MAESSKTRLEKVSFNLVRGMNETKIAESLGVSRQTIVRDVAFLKRSAHSWLDGLGKDGFIFEYKLALERIKEDRYELQKLLDESKNVGEKIAILEAMDKNAIRYLQMLGETPTIHAFRKATKKEAIASVSES